MAQEQLVQAQKMEGIGQLTGGVAHDFNNLLTIVLGNLDALATAVKDRTQDVAKLTRHIESAQRGAQRAASLTQRLRAFSRRAPLDPRVIELGRLVTGMSDLLRRSLGERIAIETIERRAELQFYGLAMTLVLISVPSHPNLQAV